jgi:hypothetical protein
MTARGRGPVLARLARPAGPATTLLVVADSHLTSRATGTWKLFHRTEERLRAAIEGANRLGVDAVLGLGDLTRAGAPHEFDRLDALLADLDAPFLAVPGNHDVQKPGPDGDSGSETPPVEAFAERYAPGALPFAERIGGIDVLGLDSATAPDGEPSTTHGGASDPRAVPADGLAWLDAALDGAGTPVVALHHPIADASIRDGGGLPTGGYRVRNADAVTELLAGHGVPLVLSGHVHWPSVALLGGARGPSGDRERSVNARGHEITAPATCSFPQAALLVQVEPRGTTVSLLPLAGRTGYEEAHRHARRARRGRRLVEATEDGYFERFPLVDTFDASVPVPVADGPAPTPLLDRPR